MDAVWTRQDRASDSDIGRAAFDDARRRALQSATRPLEVGDPLDWHRAIFEPLGVEPVRYVGSYRDEHDLVSRVHWEGGDVPWQTVLPDLLEEELAEFFVTFNSRTEGAGDAALTGQDPSLRLDAQMRVLAWIYAEWLRIHPLADGNGRTGVCLVDFAARRMGLPSFLLRSGSLKPRDASFCEAVRRACRRQRTTEDANRYEDLAEVFALEMERMFDAIG